MFNLVFGVVIGMAIMVLYITWELDKRGIERPEGFSIFEILTKSKDNREHIWPNLNLSLEQIEGMFAYNQSMDYNTPYGIIHIVPDEDCCMNFPNRRVN